MVRTILLKSELVDQALLKMKWGNRKYIQYILFKHSITQIRLRLLHVNAIKNVPVQYKFITKVSLVEKVVYKGQELELRDALLEVKVDSEKLFVAAEQRLGK